VCFAFRKYDTAFCTVQSDAKVALQVAFITGRTEDGRDFTEKNLLSEGYGARCPKDANGKALHPQGMPCYVALHMRNLQGARTACLCFCCMDCPATELL
jgi:hypothetical protein